MYGHGEVSQAAISLASSHQHHTGSGARRARSVASMLRLVSIAVRRACRRSAKGGVGGIAIGCQPCGWPSRSISIYVRFFVVYEYVLFAAGPRAVGAATRFSLFGVYTGKKKLRNGLRLLRVLSPPTATPM